MRRDDGYADIRDYAVVGDGRTAALVASDGAIDWLCLPDIDSPSIFAAVLDANRGGSLTLQPTIPFSTKRRYLPHTNVLETTFVTELGTVRVIDAMPLPDDRLGPMRWRLSPRFEYGTVAGRLEWRAGVPAATYGSAAAALRSWDAGAPRWTDGAAAADFEVA